MKHSTIQRIAAGTLSTLLACGSLPAPALAEATHTLHAQGAGRWEHDGSRWTYRLTGGLATGWQNVDGTWYLFGQDASMLTGWQRDNNTWYYLGSSGGMYFARWLLDGETWYYLLPSGAMATGWEFVNGAWYYFYPSGAMAQDTEIDGCWLDTSGAWDEAARPGESGNTLALLGVDQTVDPNAAEAVLSVTSDIPFAQDLNSSTVALGGALSGFEITDVKRSTTSVALVRIAKTATNDDEIAAHEQYAGTVSFASGSFAEPSAEGVAALDVAHKAATQSNRLGSYLNESFVLTLDLGSAQMPPGSDVSCFSLPANSDITVKDATLTDWDHSAALTLSVPGDTPYQQFKTLEDALAHGLRVTGTSIGDLVAYPEGSSGDTPLAFVAPELTAFIERPHNNKGYLLNDEGGASIQLVLRVISSGGDPNLTNSSIQFSNELAKCHGSATDQEAPYRTTLDMGTLTAGDIAELKELTGIEDTDELLDAYVHLMASAMAQGVSIGGGITNEWGIELPDDELVSATCYNLAGLGETGAANEAVEEQALSVQADDKSDEEKVKRVTTTMKYTAEVLKFIGGIATSIGSENPGGAIAGFGGFLGFIANEMAPTSWTTVDVMNQLLAVDSKIDAVSAQLGDISHQLEQLSSDVDYKTQVGKITELAVQGLAYRPWVTKALNAIKDASDRDSFLSTDDPSKSTTGTALKNLAEQTKLQSKQTGKGLTTYNIASDLADAITGNGTTQQTGAVASFFNHTAAQVNWEPETYYARSAFISYVGDAFANAYAAAMNELSWEIAATHDANEKLVKHNSKVALAKKAEEVNALIGESGSLMAGAQDRGDKKVLCTVNGRLYPKAFSSWGTDALHIVLRGTEDTDFKSVIGPVLSNRNEDKDGSYSNQSTMSRSDFETMAKREAYVRTIPEYSGCTSIYNEMQKVGIMPQTPQSNGAQLGYSRCSISIHRDHEFSYALVGDPERTSKNDAASVYHKRTYSADMYDIKNNKALGKTTLYYYNVNYHAGAMRWYVDLDVYPCFEMRSA